jgi:hypothetical protein
MTNSDLFTLFYLGMPVVLVGLGALAVMLQLRHERKGRDDSQPPKC